jgi:hypothetical protein
MEGSVKHDRLLRLNQMIEEDRSLMEAVIHFIVVERK